MMSSLLIARAIASRAAPQCTRAVSARTFSSKHADLGAEFEGVMRACEANNVNRFGKDYLLTWDMPQKDINLVFHTARALEFLYRGNISCKVWDSGLAVSNFRDKSTRTKSAFASAANLLGLTVMDFDESKSQVGHGETTRESAVMLSFLAEVIGIRDDMFIGEGHKYQVEVADAVEESAQCGVLAQRPTVVNLQCDLDHPTQTMADTLHMAELFGGLENLRGKKIAMTWAHSPSYGKPLSVPQGIVGLLPRFGMEVVLAHPPGYELLPEVLQQAGRLAKEHEGKFTMTDSMEEAFVGADVVYPKSWAPLDIMQRRSELYSQGVNSEEILRQLESECIELNANHKNWECTEEMMKLTGDGTREADYMHCLPADITDVSCKEGEVAASVFERHRLATYREAGHKPFVVAANMLLGRFPDVPKLLRDVFANHKPKKGI